MRVEIWNKFSVKQNKNDLKKTRYIYQSKMHRIDISIYTLSPHKIHKYEKKI